MTRLSRRTFTAAAAMSLASGRASAQRLSDRPITFIVPTTAGSGPDVLARLLAEEFRARWDQPVVVENRSGASGNIGTGVAARAAPDGHTMLVTVNTFVMGVSLYKNVPYDPQTSFVPVGEIAKGGLALVVHPSVPAKTTPELIAMAKADPGGITYATPGRGTPQHLAMELFKLTTKADLKHVPYTGSAGAVKDLLGGHVRAMFLPIHTALPLAAEERLRILAVGSEKRWPHATDVPTLAEQGVPGFEVDLWYGMLAPAGTSPDIVARYNTTLNEILATPAVVQALAKQGLIAQVGPPEKLAELIRRDQPRWARVVREAGITAE